MKKIETYLRDNAEKFENELFEFLRIPSISTDSNRKEDLSRAADYLRRQMNQLGFDKAELYSTPGHPIVYGEYCPHKDRPTVLVYGHYDVQPPDPESAWTTPPFEPTVRDGRVYARGSSDDKGQSFTHLKAVESWIKTGETPPVNLKFLFEGEEEIGSPNLAPFIENHKEMLACDMVLVSDTAMFDEDQPSITYGLRGLTYMQIHVQGPGHDLHSGVFGGAVANPANALCEIITSFKDKNGTILIPGFYDDVKPLTEEERDAYRILPFDEKRYKASIGVSELHGENGFSTLERSSGRPSLDVNGLWSGYQGEGAKTVLPSTAGAKVSMRLVPGQDPKKIEGLFRDYIRAVSPQGVTVTVTSHHGGHPSLTDLDFYGLKAAADAFKKVYDKEVLFTREGGSIPVVADFKRILGVNTILMGFGLTDDALHSPNESFSLKDFHRGIRTSATFMGILTDYQP